jgi:ABC-type thiamine transport system ATPase subunit
VTTPVRRLELDAVAHGPLRAAAGSFAPACTVLTGDDAGALAAFVAVASGAVSPRRGRVLLDGAPLAALPAARRCVASLLAVEALPVARTVAEAVERVLVARGDERRALDVLAAGGLDVWSRRVPAELDHDERRSLALALAVAHESASVVVLFEPFATSASAALDVEAALTRATARGAIVVLATASLRGAARFGGPHCWLTAGVLTSVEPMAAPLSPALDDAPHDSASPPAPGSGGGP